MSKINLVTSASRVKDANKEIGDYRSGKLKPLSTGINFMDEVLYGGFFRQKIYTLAAMSGGGKSHWLQEIEDYIFNNNPEQVGITRFSYEMSFTSLYIRALKRELNRGTKYILFEEFTEAEKAIAAKVYQRMKTENVLYQEVPLNADEMVEALEQANEKFKHLPYHLVSIDHLALTPNDNGKQNVAIENLIKVVNDSKKKYSNMIFILLTQLNRELGNRTQLSDMPPRVSDIYYSSAIEFISDAIFVRHLPYKKLGKEKYMSFSPAMYPHLKEHMVDENSDSYTSFHTKNRVFLHLLKLREDDGDAVNLDILPYNPDVPFDDLKEGFDDFSMNDL